MQAPPCQPNQLQVEVRRAFLPLHHWRNFVQGNLSEDAVSLSVVTFRLSALERLYNLQRTVHGGD